MVTSAEVKVKMEQEIKVVYDSILNRIEKKINEKFANDMNQNDSAMSELLIHGKIYVGYSFMQRKLQSEFGFDYYSTVWDVLIIKVEEILKKNLAEAGWKLEGDYLVPVDDEQKEQ